MKKIIVFDDTYNGSHFSVFSGVASSVPVVKVRKLCPFSTATRVIRPLKGGGYRRKEKFDKSLTAQAE